MSKKKSDLGEFLDDLVRIGIRELKRALGVADEQALDKAMRAVADAILVEYARRDIYVPAAYDPRNREIYRKYGEASRSARANTPERVIELSLEYALTTRQIYGIIASQAAADMAARQPKLPGFEPEA